MEENNSIIYSKEVIEFTTLATNYCAFLENSEKIEKKELIEKSHKLLTFIYLKAITLPDIKEVSDSFVQKFVSETDYNFIKEKVAEVFSDEDNYIRIPATVISYHDEESDFTVSELFADIYQDLRDFIESFKTNVDEIMLEALWEMINNFQQIWGHKLLALLNEFHFSLYGNEK